MGGASQRRTAPSPIPERLNDCHLAEFDYVAQIAEVTPNTRALVPVSVALLPGVRLRGSPTAVQCAYPISLAGLAQQHAPLVGPS